MNRMWAVTMAVTIVIALVTVWVYFASDAQFDALLVPATACCNLHRSIHLILWVTAIIMLGMIGQNLDATIHREKRRR
jgi:hypothetical protein